ncbi:MAG: hypothetical protein ABI323_08785, partial [Solirubrobacteraceae bacterium]
MPSSSPSVPAPAPGAEPSPEVLQDPPEADLAPWPIWTVPAAIVLGLGIGTVATILVELVGAVGGSSLAHPSPAVNIASDVIFDLSFVAAALYFAFQSRRARLADF